MNWQDFSNHLQQILSLPIQITHAHSISGGDIHQAYRLQCQNQDYFLKLNHLQSLPLFETEAHNLSAIVQSQSISCPKVIGFGEYRQYAWLLMEFLPFTHHGDDFQRGKDLAKMHHQLNQDNQPFGWFEDNYIGHTRQSNQWHFEWTDFYAQQRLKPQLELAQLNGASRLLYDNGMMLIEYLPHWFKDYSPKASLIHGDLWGGNSVFIKTENSAPEAVIFDPASYYGDRETDIAMTELFGGFSQAFYQGYDDAFPLDSGYSSRKPLYNLYHILNHYNLFGGHYESQASDVIKSLLSKVR